MLFQASRRLSCAKYAALLRVDRAHQLRRPPCLLQSSPGSSTPGGSYHSCLTTRAFSQDHRSQERQAEGIDSSTDYYKVLGVRAGAPDADIKKAFYQLAKKYHPDSTERQSNTVKAQYEAQFKRVSEAYEVLGNKDKRSLYDDMRQADASERSQRNNYKADQTWSYTYDEQGNKRTQTYTSHQQDRRNHYSSKSYEQARQDYYSQSHGVGQDGQFRYQGGERYTANWQQWAQGQAQTSFWREEQKKQQQEQGRRSGGQFNQAKDPYASRQRSGRDGFGSKEFNMPAGLTTPRLVFIVGLVLIFGTGFIVNPGLDLTDGASPPQGARGGSSAPRGYAREVVVDPKTGAVSSVSVISDQARQQKGGLVQQDLEELRRQKEERIAEAKRIRRERKRLYKQQQDELDELQGKNRKSISSEEYFSSKNDMVQQAEYSMLDQPKERPAEKQEVQEQSKDVEEMKQRAAQPPLIIVEQTPEGPKEHVFYGEVKVLGQDGDQKLVSVGDNKTKEDEEKKLEEQIQKEQEELLKFIEAKKQRLKQLQMIRMQNTQNQIDELEQYDGQGPTYKQRQEAEFRRQKRESVEVRINPKLIGADINFQRQAPVEPQHVQGGPSAR